MKKVFLQNSKIFRSKIYLLGLSSIGFFANSCTQDVQSLSMKEEESKVSAKKVESKVEEGSGVKVESDIKNIGATNIKGSKSSKKEIGQVLDKESFVTSKYSEIDQIDEKIDELKIKKKAIVDSINEYVKDLREKIKVKNLDLKAAKAGLEKEKLTKEKNLLEIELEKYRVITDTKKLNKKTDKLAKHEAKLVLGEEVSDKEVSDTEDV